MAEKSISEQIVARTQSMIRQITDPVELRRQLEEMFATEFPKPAPIFRIGDKMKMHEFLDRFQRSYCGGIVPQFYDRQVTIVASNPRHILVAIPLAPHGSRLTPDFDLVPSGRVAADDRAEGVMPPPDPQSGAAGTHPPAAAPSAQTQNEGNHNRG